MSYQSIYSGEEVDESVSNYRHSKVNTLDELNSFDTSKLKDGWKCYVISTDTEYRWKNGEWNKLATQNSLLTENYSESSKTGAKIDKDGAKIDKVYIMNFVRSINYIAGLFGFNISQEGIGEFKSIISNFVSIFKKGINFGSYEKDVSGGSIYIDENGNSSAEFDFIKIRKTAYFRSITVTELKHIGGELILTPAAMICSMVEEQTDSYRCYFDITDGKRTIYQEFVVGDGAICQQYKYESTSNGYIKTKYYWRKVVAIGDNYIDLSKNDRDMSVENSIPSVNDNISQLGYLGSDGNNFYRRSAIILSTVSGDSPSQKMYQGISSFSLVGCIIKDEGYSDGLFHNNIYGNFYAGTKDSSSYLKFTTDNGVEIKGKLSSGTKLDNGSDINQNFTEILQTENNISAKVNSSGFINSYDPSVYGKVIKGTPYTFWLDQYSEFAAVCSTLTGLTVGNKYTVKIPVKNVDCVSGATFDAYISATEPTLTSYQENGEYHLIDFSTQGDIYIQFTATSTTMYAGVITGSAGWTNNTGGYAHVEIHSISLFTEDIINALYATGLDIILHKIIATANSFVIRDNNGNINTVFEIGEDGIPYLKAQYIKTNNLDIDGTFSERYTFVERGTFNKVDFSTVNNIAVNRGIDPTPAIVVLPMYSAYTGGNFNTTAYQKAGTNISIQNSYNPNMKNWKEAATLINGSGKASLRYQLAASSVIVVSDPRIISYNNYTGSVPTIYPNGSGNANDSVEYRKGRMFCNGKSSRIAMILPGQTLRLQSAVEVKDGISYLVWYVVNASEYTSINKGMQIVGANSLFGSDVAGSLAFSATNTYSNWGESGDHDTDFLIAPKELDAYIGGQTYAIEEPSIVLDCSETTQYPLFNLTER